VDDSAVSSDFALLAAWVRTLRARGLSPKTIRIYTYGVFQLLTEYVKDGPRAARPEHVDAFFEAMGHRSTAKVKYLQGCRSFFAWCLARGEAEIDPTAGFKLKAPQKKRPVASRGSVRNGRASRSRDRRPPPDPRAATADASSVP
jgi:site-specific recombinase XerC